jgi:hypothetical protein
MVMQGIGMAGILVKSGLRARSSSTVLPNHLTVEITGVERFSAVTDAWQDLVARAAVPNVAMHPSVAAAAQATKDRVHVILVWHAVKSNKSSRLVGAWVLAERRHSRRFPLRVLQSPVDAQMMLSTPVIDADFMSEAFTAMLDAIAAATTLPKIMYLNEFTGDGTAFLTFNNAFAARGGQPRILNYLRRPKLQSDLDGRVYLEHSLSAEKRRELRRCRRRLEERGLLSVTSHRTSEEAKRAFE